MKSKPAQIQKLKTSTDPLTEYGDNAYSKTPNIQTATRHSKLLENKKGDDSEKRTFRCLRNKPKKWRKERKYSKKPKRGKNTEQHKQYLSKIFAQ